MSIDASSLPLLPASNQPVQAMPLNKGLLAVQGPDAVKFLQGQVTCDIKELTDGQVRLGAHCTPKGRMLASFQALQPATEEVWLLMPREEVAFAQSSLGKYIVFSKAKLVDLSEDYRFWGFSGDGALSLLENHLGPLPAADANWQKGEGFWILRLNSQRFLVGVAPEAAPLIDTLINSAELVSENYWTLLDIAAGLGEVRASSRELFTPQSLNFQWVNGINFRKGCYTGQEIVARLHYRGALKRHMYRFAAEDLALTSGQLPPPGQRVVNSAGQNIGELVIAAVSGADRLELLANVAEDQCEDAFLLWPESDPAPKKLGLLPLPYAIPKADKP